VRDDDVRSACFAALDVLQAKWGADVPYAALAEGFNFRGRRVPFLNRAYGIYRAADVQHGLAALFVNSSYKQDQYRDEQTPDGVLYRYQGDDPENHFNRWLRSAHLLDVPLVYFVGTRPNCTGRSIHLRRTGRTRGAPRSPELREDARAVRRARGGSA
jgi:putative restriction endonuclease